mmetsp:Transcript_41809/g.90199  ORF Transcript_41809/g.90199 Transcript_41809/m.90199 type:complete len:675 (-) Transcript_41809:156-2180(-)
MPPGKMPEDVKALPQEDPDEDHADHEDDDDRSDDMEDDDDDEVEESKTMTGNSVVEDPFYTKHKCTDPVCAILFGVCVLAMLYIWGWAAWNGDLAKLSHGIDRSGQVCGVSPNVTDKPFLYYCPQKFTWENNTWQIEVGPDDPVCVRSCPDLDLKISEPEVPPLSRPDCPQNQEKAYTTKLTADWFCLPDMQRLNSSEVQLQRSIGSLKQGESQLFGIRNGWPILLAVALVAVALGYIYLILLRLLAKGLIWLSLGFCIVALAGASWYFWAEGHTALTSNNNMTIAEMQEMDLIAKVVSVVAAITACGVMCLSCCCASEIDLSTRCLQQSTQVLWKMPLILLAPLVKAIAKGCLALAFFYGCVLLWSTAKVTGQGTNRHYDFTPEQEVYIAIWIAVSFWILELVSAIYQFSIAYAVAKYYYTPSDNRGDRAVDPFALVQGTKVGVMSHLGSLAFGSAIITVLELIEKALQYAELKDEEDNNQVVECMVRCILCCCRCVRICVEYVSKNAYIDMAVSASNFCTAIRNVGHVMLDHGAAMAVLNGANFLFQVVGVVGITTTCGLMAWALLGLDTFSHTSSSYYVANHVLATAVACGLALIVSWAFMTVFDMTSDTLLFCMAMDIRQHGSAVNADHRLKELFNQARQTAARAQRAKEQKQQKLQATNARGAAKNSKR